MCMIVFLYCCTFYFCQKNSVITEPSHPVSLCLLASYPYRLFGGESGDRVSSGVSPLCLSLSSHPSLVLSARHAPARLFGLKVLYLSFPSLATCHPCAWVNSHEAASIMPDKILQWKTTPWTHSPMSAHDKWGMDTDNCSWGMGGNQGGGQYEPVWGLVVINWEIALVWNILFTVSYSYLTTQKKCQWQPLCDWP